jgi:hypothetical protein
MYLFDVRPKCSAGVYLEHKPEMPEVVAVERTTQYFQGFSLRSVSHPSK